MADSVRLAEYFYIPVPDKPGEGARALATLKDAGINLLAFSGFSRRAALANGLRPRRPSRVQAGGEEGHVEGYRSQTRVPRAGRGSSGGRRGSARPLGTAKINVTAIDAISAGDGRYGVILWVAAKDVKKAATLLGVSAASAATVET